MLKRLFDIVMALLGLILLSPIFILIAILIKLDSSGEVFFRQVRVGLYNAEFKIFKFRTMTTNNQGLQITVGDDARITRVGQTLRKYKLDELPQLINVLMGDMSLVGPRPEVPHYVKFYSDEQCKVIFSVRPGITDWASIMMIDENQLLAQSSNPDECYVKEIMPIKLAYAMQYANNHSLWQDVKIILTTIIKIIR